MMETSSPPYRTTELPISMRIIPVFTALIGIFATITNSLSLSYFITKIRSKSPATRNADKLITPKLFLVLNIFDLLVTVSATVCFCAIPTKQHLLQVISENILYVLVMMTSFLTCLLAAVRAINLILTFYIINWGFVKVSIYVYSLYIVVFELMLISFQYSAELKSLEKKLYCVEFFTLVSLFSVVVVSNLLAIGKLFISKSQTQTWKTTRKATVTVGILSVIYCVCNIGYIVIHGLNRFSTFKVLRSIPIELGDTFLYILLPLNSACNPAVYLIRKADMRTHLKTLWRRLTGWIIALCVSSKWADKRAVQTRRGSWLHRSLESP